MKSVFNFVETAAPIEMVSISKGFKEDTFDHKVNLGIEAYRTNEDTLWVLPVVREVEKQMANGMLDYEYLSPLGLQGFTTAALALLFGKDSPVIVENRAFGIQTLSGTGALRVGAEFLARIMKYTIFYSFSSWGNQRTVFLYAGFTECREYRYWNPKTKSLDIEAFLEDLNNAPENSVIILQLCAHDPTGCDPTPEQWKLIADVMENRKLFPFFDSSFQGFATGDVDKDAFAVRYFIKRGFELFCAQSFAKIFGLYNQRIGNLAFVVNNIDAAIAVKSQFSIIVRAMYSNPPSHGARVVSQILNTPQLYEQWTQCILTMANRIKDMREALYSEIKKLNTPGNWENIITQIGTYSYTGFNIMQCRYMMEKHHIYMFKTGQISMCGINTFNVKYIAKAIYDTVTSLPAQES